MKKIIWFAGLALAFALSSPAWSQTRNALTVPTCADTTHWTSGYAGALTVLPDGSLCISGGGGGGVVTQPTASLLNMTEVNSAATLAAVQGAIPAGTNVIGHVIVDTAPTTAVTIASLPTGAVTQGTSPWVVATAAADPCQTQTPIIKPFSIPTGTTTNILTGTSAKKIYICYWYTQTGIANNYAIIEGTTGATCGAGTAALVGGVTAATGLINSATSGQAMGNGGYAIMQTATNNNDICVITSASGPLAGVMKYVVQ